MTRKRTHSVGLGAVALAFAAGMLADSWLRVYGPPQPRVVTHNSVEARPTAITPLPPAEKIAPAAAGTAVPPPGPVATTGRIKLQMPIDGITVDSLKGGFAEARTGHVHEAVDMLAPRNTPVHAVESGTIAKLFFSKAGGNTIYQFDPSGRLAYYYAHLDRYANDIREGDSVAQGQVIGYVGTTGNAPPSTPHLHFAVFELGPERQWWKGKAVDPYLVFR